MITLKQARSDLKYLDDTYGSANDYCGSFCNSDKLWDILMGKETVLDVIISNIEYYFSNGIEDDFRGCSSDIFPSLEDKRVQRIINRYNIDVSRIEQ